MKVFMKRTLAVLLAALLLFSCATVGVGAQDTPITATTNQMYTVEKLFRAIANAVLGMVGNLFKYRGLQTYDAYMAEPDAYFYAGTDGEVAGDGWRLGYASASVIPTAWRQNAAGRDDADGFCLNDSYYFGGYFTAKVDKIYDDQRVNLVVMSCGSDANGNGVEDILLFAALDGVGFGNQDIRAIRAAAEEKLAAVGVEKEDILGFNMNVTHAHSTVDPQGMGLDLIGPLFKTRFVFGERVRSVQAELLASIIKNTADAALVAYERMTPGALYYFDSAEVLCDGSGYELVNDKRNVGQKVQDHFANFLFEGANGENTVLSNIGMHPTKVPRDSARVCADVPYYIGEAMNEAGFNFVFFQGAQGSVGLSANADEAGLAWAREKALSYDDWKERYGEKYANEHFETGEADYLSVRAAGYTIAHLILDAFHRAQPIAATLNVTMAETAIPLDYSLLYLGGVTQLLGMNCVRFDDAVSRYALMVEIGCIDLGGDVTILTMPGEIFPALVYGSVPGYAGEKSWTGPTSWTGEDWTYDTLENSVRTAAGDADRTVLAFGLCNDAVGYILPDTDAAHFSVDWFYGGHYEELLTPSVRAGSALTQGYIELFADAY